MHTRRMVVAVVALCALFVSVWMLPEVAASEGARGPAKPLAEMTVGAGRVDWQPAGDYEHLTLTVAGPGGLWFRQEFAAGQPPSLRLVDQNGQQLPDGAYAYELRLVPHKMGNLPERPLLQAGSFAVRAGSFVASLEERKTPGDVESATEAQIQNVTAATEVIPDDLIVQGKACIGDLCESGEPLYESLKLKDYTVGILFEDVSEGFSYDRDWLLLANPFLGGPEHFFLQDVDAGTIPFSVQGEAPDYSLVVGGDSVVSGNGGNIGVGTAIPAKAVHVARTDTPTLRLEDTYTGTFPGIRIWDIGASSTELFVKDVTNSSAVPFRIQAGAPTDSLRVSSTGQVGIGTASPSYKLHVSGSAGSTQGVIEETNGTAALRTMLELRNNGNIRLGYVDTSTGANWGASLVAGNYTLNKAGANNPLSLLDGSGNLTIKGVYYSNSNRETKRDIVPVQPEEVLAKVATLPIATWNHKTEDPAVRHMGPMAQDFAAIFGLGDDNRHVATLDMAGVSLAAVQALNKKVAEKEEEIAQLRRANDDLAQRLAALEVLVLKGGREETELSPAP